MNGFVWGAISIQGRWTEEACHGKKAQSGLGGEAVNACQGLKRSKFRGSQHWT